MTHAGGSEDIGGPHPVVGMLPWPDRFEDFHDKVGISLEDFRDRLSGTWLVSYVDALRFAGIRPILYFFSARIRRPVRFVHASTGVPVRVFPSPRLHRKMQGARDRFDVRSRMYGSALSYAATPWIRLAREWRRDRCAAILCQVREYARFDEGVVLGRLLRLPVFATLQGANEPWSLLERPFRKAAIRQAAGLIAGSRAEIDRVRRDYGVAPERTAWIPNPFDVRRWEPLDRSAARAALGIPPDVPVVVWHGRVEVYSKGVTCWWTPGDRSAPPASAAAAVVDRLRAGRRGVPSQPGDPAGRQRPLGRPVRAGPRPALLDRDLLCWTETCSGGTCRPRTSRCVPRGTKGSPSRSWRR
jgi:hypothetical protein